MAPALRNAKRGLSYFVTWRYQLTKYMYAPLADFFLQRRGFFSQR